MLQLTQWFGALLPRGGAHGINVFGGFLKDCRTGVAGGEVVLECRSLFPG
jgi:hypothetical protein